MTGESRQPKRKANATILALILLLTIAALTHAYLIVGQRLAHDDDLLGGLRRISHHAPVKPVKAEKLQREAEFEQSIKSCLPSLSSKCLTYTPLGVARVAVLAPPGDFGDWVFSWIMGVVNAQSLGSTVHMHVEKVSHIPPYGYGKTHGWTKIVRVLPRSLMLGAADAIRGTLALGETQNQLSISDIKASLRMILRWHCRISHVAAHTAVLSLNMDTVAGAPAVAKSSLLAFLNITAASHGEVVNMESNHQEDSEDTGQFASPEVLHGMKQSDTLSEKATSLLTYVEALENVAVKDVLSEILADELNITKGFQAWPCLSFWSSGDAAAPLTSKYSRTLANSLSPDCHGRNTKCVVKRDQCEEEGDPICG